MEIYEFKEGNWRDIANPFQHDTGTLQQSLTSNGWNMEAPLLIGNNEIHATIYGRMPEGTDPRHRFFVDIALGTTQSGVFVRSTPDLFKLMREIAPTINMMESEDDE